MKQADIRVAAKVLDRHYRWKVMTDRQNTGEEQLLKLLRFEFSDSTRLSDGGYNFEVSTDVDAYDQNEHNSDIACDHVRARVHAILTGYYAPEDDGLLAVKRLDLDLLGPLQVAVRVNRATSNRGQRDALAVELPKIHGVSDALAISGQYSSRLTVVLASDLFDVADVAAEMVGLAYRVFGKS